MLEMMQGDAGTIGIRPKWKVRDQEGHVVGYEIIPIGAISAVEIALGDNVKTYPGDITYENEYFHFPFSQEESLMLAGEMPLIVRIRFKDGQVRGKLVSEVIMFKTKSREVI